MKFQIRHEIRGRMRIHVIQSRMSLHRQIHYSIIWNSVNL